jgi:hypothetical protein
MSEMILLSPKQLRRAANLKERLDRLQNELSDLLGAPVQAGDGAPAKRKKFSAATRAKMRAAQKARWAGHRTGRPSAKPGKVGKRKMSAAHRAKLAAAARARWKNAKAAGKTTL